MRKEGAKNAKKKESRIGTGMDENSLSNLVINRAIKSTQGVGSGFVGIFISRMSAL